MIIFSDLDGSLLNHEDYSFAAARPSIARIKRTGIPLIITTSKTRLEVELLQQDMGIREPFIVENGGGIFFPYGYRDFMIENGEWDGDYTLIRIGTTYSTIRNFLKKVGARFEIRGFGDLTIEEISGLTGLSPDRAEMAKAREFTEPFLLKRPDGIGCLSALAAETELKVTRGGRFHHLIGREQDKGVAVRMVIDIFKINSGEELTTIGIGDSENDLPMLEQVDIPVLIPRPGKGCLDIRMPGLVRAMEPGCRGWNEVVERLLNEYGKVAANES
ncbi:MAG: HAD-IIB family hydrolase [Proteobacteria bacterium]|nr:HAD-IIB family hydrolase [Pseudomonadota bacterium]